MRLEGMRSISTYNNAAVVSCPLIAEPYLGRHGVNTSMSGMTVVHDRGGRHFGKHITRRWQS